LVTVSREPISRDEAAKELGISCELAAFHVDRLLDAGMLEAEYRRLRGAGYVPELDSVSGAVCLRNCPYHALAESHRVLTCGMNLAWADGVAHALGDSRLRPELDPKPGYCCVVFQPATARR
jgi:predicted ArsR family transcriptional regulator